MHIISDCLVISENMCNTIVFVGPKPPHSFVIDELPTKNYLVRWMHPDGRISGYIVEYVTLIIEFLFRAWINYSMIH